MSQSQNIALPDIVWPLEHKYQHTTIFFGCSINWLNQKLSNTSGSFRNHLEIALNFIVIMGLSYMIHWYNHIQNSSNSN